MASIQFTEATVRILMENVEKIPVRENFDPVKALENIWNRLRLRIEMKHNLAENYPLCKINPKGNLVALKSEIDKIALLGEKLPKVSVADKAYMKAAYLLANYTLGIPMEEQVATKFEISDQYLNVAVFVLQFVKDDNVNNGHIVKLIGLCKNVIISCENLDEKLKKAADDLPPNRY